jgi:hypothetical protein
MPSECRNVLSRSGIIMRVAWSTSLERDLAKRLRAVAAAVRPVAQQSATEAISIVARYGAIGCCGHVKLLQICARPILHAIYTLQPLG